MPGASCVLTQAAAVRPTTAGLAGWAPADGRALADRVLAVRALPAGVSPPGAAPSRPGEIRRSPGPALRRSQSRRGHRPPGSCGWRVPSVGQASPYPGQSAGPGESSGEWRGPPGLSLHGRRWAASASAASGSAALGSAALASAVLTSAVAGPAGAWSGWRSGGANATSGVPGTASCGWGRRLGGHGNHGDRLVFASPGVEVPGLDTDCATPATGCGPPLPAGLRPGDGMELVPGWSASASASAWTAARTRSSKAGDSAGRATRTGGWGPSLMPRTRRGSGLGAAGDAASGTAASAAGDSRPGTQRPGLGDRG